MALSNLKLLRILNGRDSDYLDIGPQKSFLNDKFEILGNMLEIIFELLWSSFEKYRISLKLKLLTEMIEFAI